MKNLTASELHDQAAQNWLTEAVHVLKGKGKGKLDDIHLIAQPLVCVCVHSSIIGLTWLLL